MQFAMVNISPLWNNLTFLLPLLILSLFSYSENALNCGFPWCVFDLKSQQPSLEKLKINPKYKNKINLSNQIIIFL